MTTRFAQLLGTTPHKCANRDEHGAVLVEAAIGFGLVFFSILALAEAGLLFSTVSTTNNAARSGARLAAASYAAAGSKTVGADTIRTKVEAGLDALTGFGVPETLWIYKAGTNPAACSASCYRFSWNGTAARFGLDASSPGWSDPDACEFDGTIDSIGVRVTVRHRTATGLFGDQIVDEHTVMRLEPLPSAQCP